MCVYVNIRISICMNLSVAGAFAQQTFATIATQHTAVFTACVMPHADCIPLCVWSLHVDIHIYIDKYMCTVTMCMS